MILTIISGTTTIYLLYKLLSFIYYYVLALRTGFPLLLSPIFAKSILWQILAPAVLPSIRGKLPLWIVIRLELVVNGWEFRWRHGEAQRFVGGDTFVVVCPDGLYMWCSDPVLGSVILQRRKDFIQGDVVKQFIGIFGSNVLQVWQRQRRIIAPHLSEGIMATVWKESCLQARDMIAYLVEHPGGETLGGLRSVAINVLGSAAYGYSQSWSPGIAYGMTEEGNWGSGRIAYFKTIALVADQFIAAVLIPSWIKKLPFMPKWLRVIDRQMANVPRYVKEIFDAELQKKTTEIPEGKDKHNNNVLDMLLQYSQKKTTNGLYLTEDEMSGNLWVFTAAGFDTTANTMGYAVILLAAYPEYQEWMREELCGLDADISPEEYEKCFALCPRVLAVMFETLRLFTPVLHSTRTVNGIQQLAGRKGTHILSSPMDVFVCAQIMHCDTTLWGPDAAEFNPKRWFDKQTNLLIKPPKDTFLPWSGGPRVCPGMKMSQVEFVATIATLFRQSRCEVLTLTGKEEEGRKRLMDMMDDSISKLTLQVRNGQEVKLRWVV
ncbi:cytochrome P450, putative [Talaromyces stipitatus ATCC 10500]|uniref:Cytochrome P450, putative n=1 Tax=Talaromyces stipitatus (strain ATCC 10500 / CBS 375.48 / QM 6759 / NRRL 1006) TaxID=441959 RepID=B8LUQ9_TALSN|nr:cytochrome P450, putative [Talaromyces stipitatus ATCC 10500]EED23916.1 cytochrome P450, putative [Talaromyces stipitatus ATCC 10500]